MHRPLAMLAGCAALAATAGCAPHPRGPTTSPSPPRAVIATTSAAHPVRHEARLRIFPATIHAVPLALHQRPSGALPIGARVPSADIGVDVSISGEVRFGLANQGSVFGNVYPAMSTDAGTEWLINGPRFSYAGADGQGRTNHVDVSRNGTLLAWGLGGNFVKTSTDRGRQWDEADFFGGVESVKAVGDELVVQALGDQTSRNRFLTRRYVSRNDGRTWHRGQALPTVP
jgi:hypothetical protein